MRLPGRCWRPFPTGRSSTRPALAEFERLNVRARHARHTLVPFLEQIDEVMEAASLLVSRAGASTCAELKAAGRGAILVPLPTSADDHQLLNARALAADGSRGPPTQGEDSRGPAGGPLPGIPVGWYARIRLGGLPEPNRSVGACLEDLARVL